AFAGSWRSDMALYSNVIRDRFRRPRYRGTLERPDVSGEDVNPLCGDRVRIQANLADGRLVEGRWTGDCCAISAACADVLLEMARGLPASTVCELTTETILECFVSAIRESRMKCVALPLTVLQGALTNE